VSLEVKLYANFGTGEPWVARLAVGLPRLIDGCRLGSDRRDAATDAVSLVVETVGMAFEALRDVERLASQGDDAPELALSRAYANLYGHLWQARKDRWQKLAKALGFDVGFMFKRSEEFEAGAVRFAASHPGVPAPFVGLARQDRATWQDALSVIRNDHLEHRKPVDPRLVQAFFRPDSARTMFDNTWQALEDGTVLLLESLVPEGVEIVEIPHGDRDIACPLRWGFDVPALRAAIAGDPF